MKRFIPFFIFLFSPFILSGENTGIQKVFNEQYLAWTDHISQIDDQTSPRPFIENEPFKAIVMLGIPAVPFIIDKLGKDKNAVWLSKALEKILQIKRYESEWDKEKKQFVFNKALDIPEGVNGWIYWWKVDKYKTKERFDTVFRAFEKIQFTKSYTLYKNAYLKLRNEGAVIVPYLMEMVAKKRCSSVYMISVLTNNEVKKTDSIGKCLAWWEANKKKWLSALQLNK